MPFTEKHLPGRSAMSGGRSGISGQALHHALHWKSLQISSAASCLGNNEAFVGGSQPDLEIQGFLQISSTTSHLVDNDAFVFWILGRTLDRPVWN